MNKILSLIVLFVLVFFSLQDVGAVGHSSTPGITDMLEQVLAPSVTNITQTSATVINHITDADGIRNIAYFLEDEYGNIITTNHTGVFSGLNSDTKYFSYTTAGVLDGKTMNYKTVSSSKVSFKTLTSSVTPIQNTAPIINSIDGVMILTEGEDVDLTINATDGEGDSISFSSLNLPTWLILSGNKITGVVPVGTTGSVIFDVIPTDGKDIGIPKTVRMKSILNTAPILTNPSITGNLETAKTLTNIGLDIQDDDLSRVEWKLVYESQGNTGIFDRGTGVGNTLQGVRFRIDGRYNPLWKIKAIIIDNANGIVQEQIIAQSRNQNFLYIGAPTLGSAFTLVTGGTETNGISYSPYRLLGKYILPRSITTNELQNGSITEDKIHKDYALWKKNGNKVYIENGNVGIGVQNPTSKLDVKGNVKIGSGNLIVNGKKALTVPTDCFGDGKLLQYKNGQFQCAELEYPGRGQCPEGQDKYEGVCIDVGTMVLKYEGLDDGDKIELAFHGNVKLTTIDWGDDGVNHCDTHFSGENLDQLRTDKLIVCTYNNASKRDYTITVKGLADGYGIKFGPYRDLGIQKLKKVTKWENMGITDLSGAFYNAKILESLPNNLDISNVTNLSFMFYKAEKFNQPIGNWDTSSVVDMSYMFSGAKAFNQPIGNWNTSKVENMRELFLKASNFNQPIGNWDTSRVKDMGAMFQETIFNQPIGNWNTSNVYSMGAMFSRTKAFNQPIGNWDTSNVISMRWMFGQSERFNQLIGNWNTSKVTTMGYMFSDAKAFNQPIGNWDVSNVREFTSMFQGATRFNRNIRCWDVSNISSEPRTFSDYRLSSSNKPRWGTRGCH